MAPVRAMIVFIVAITLISSACRREVQLPSTHRPPVVKTVVVTEDERNKVKKITVPITPSLVQSVKLGPALGPSGAVEQELDSIAAGQPVYVTMKFKQVPAGSAARVVWKQADRTLAEERRELATGATTVSFKAADAESWKPGKYSVDTFMGGDEARRVDFEIVKK